MTEEAVVSGQFFRVLETPHDWSNIHVHHAGDQLAESALLGLPSCPWRHFRRDAIFGRTSTEFLSPELVRVLQSFVYGPTPIFVSEGSIHL
jgi:hypothetical protein